MCKRAINPKLEARKQQADTFLTITEYGLSAKRTTSRPNTLTVNGEH